MDLDNWIDGRPVPASTDERSPLTDPTTGGTYGTAPVSGPADVDEACQAADRAFDGWRTTTPAERGRALLRIADAMEGRAEEIVDAECRNTGKPRASMADDELAGVLDTIRFFAGAARVLEGAASAEYVARHTSTVRREPVGVCAQISPWNYPLWMATWKWAPAVAAGNTVVLKPAETTPVTALLLAELADGFLPPGVLNVVCGGRDTGAALVAHPFPALVSLTGSVRAGVDVATSAAADLKRVHLELGGKAPVLVFDDVDVAATAAGIATAGYFNAGQSCTAATRVLACPRVHDDLVAALADAAASTTTGGPDEDTTYGPLNNPDQLARVSDMVDRRGDHTEVVAGGARVPGRDGFFYAPTVLAGIRGCDELATDEVFGPVVTVERAAGEDAAVAAANASAHGLAASVWTRDHARATRVASRLDAGTVWVNCHSMLAAEMPHGGFKHSGYGKDLSRYSLEDYTRLKHVVSAWDTEPQAQPPAVRSA